MRRKPSLLLTALLLAASPALAGVLTWEEAVSQALRANPELAASRAGAAAARADYYSSYNGLLPRLSLSNSVSESDGDRDPSYSASASASMNLFDLGTIAGVRSSAASSRRAQASLRDVSAAARLELRRSFLQLLFQQENVLVADRILGLRRRQAELVGLRYDSGRESKGNRLRARAQLLQAEAALRQANRDAQTARYSLGRRLGDEGYQTAQASGTLAAAAAPPRPETLETLALARPDVAVSRAAVDAAKASLLDARSTLVPSLSANYTRGRTGRAEFPSGRYSWSAGATLSLPLFSGGPTAAYFENVSARRSLERAERDFQAARQAAVVSLQGAWADFAQADDQVAVQSALLEAARQRNDEADVRYASGLLSFDTWEIIVSDRVSQERAALSARLTSAVAEAAWERALGRALGE